MLDRLLSDWPLKLLALALAFGVWVAVTGERRIVQNFTVPLEITLRKEHTLASSPPTGITLQIDGPETVIRRLDPLKLAIRVALDSQPGDREVQLTEAFVEGVPSRARITLFEPDRVRLVIEPRLSRELPVVPDVGLPDPGHTLYAVEVRPAMVLVEGPQSEVAPLAEVRTDPISLAGRAEPFRVSVGVALARPHVRLVNLGMLAVSLVVDEDPVERTITGVRVVPEPRGTRVTPGQLSAVVAGPPHLVERLEAAQILGHVDATGLAGGRGERRVRAEFVDLLPEQVSRLSIRRLSPRQVMVEVGSERAGR